MSFCGFLKVFRPAFFAAGILISVTASAQNLLPNGDFEHPFISYDLQWKQPHGPYYHYYQDAQQSGAAFEGQFYNGLCIYNHQENEFLQARLSVPLEAGKTYCIQTMARLMKIKSFNHELHDKIGILFTNEPFQVDEPYDHDRHPQTFWVIPDSMDRMDWMTLDTTYTAEGGELYLTIGYFNRYFRDLEWSEKVEKASEDFLKPPPAAKKQFDIPPPDFSERSKKKKRSKKGKDEWANFRQQVMEEAHSHGAVIPIEEIPTKSPGAGLFTLRYYIDNVCVALMENGCDCSIEAPAVDLSEGSVVRMDNLLFETGEAMLMEGSDYALEILTLILNENPDMKIAIHGHTDDVGSDEDNRQLSEARARAVFDYLINAGIDLQRLVYIGFGSSRPVAENDTESGRALNRRVEFEIVAR